MSYQGIADELNGDKFFCRVECTEHGRYESAKWEAEGIRMSLTGRTVKLALNHFIENGYHGDYDKCTILDLCCIAVGRMIERRLKSDPDAVCYLEPVPSQK